MFEWHLVIKFYNCFMCTYVTLILLFICFVKINFVHYFTLSIITKSVSCVIMDYFLESTLIFCSFINHRDDFGFKYFCYFVPMLCVPIETDVNILNLIFGLLHRLMYQNNNISNNIILNQIRFHNFY